MRGKTAKKIRKAVALVNAVLPRRKIGYRKLKRKWKSLPHGKRNQMLIDLTGEALRASAR